MSARVRVVRKVFTDKSTIGDMFIDDVFECHTLEDTVRRIKVPKTTAIWAGTYRLNISWSPRFKKDLPVINGVDGFEGIRIHTGNFPEDTDGCILVGRKYETDKILESRLAFDALMPKIKRLLETSPLYISIIGGTHKPGD